MLLPNVKENEPLAKYTTFRIGGPAKYFVVAKSSDDVVRAVRAAREEGVAYALLGGGANTLIADKGFDGIVIKMQNRGLFIGDGIARAEAGVPLLFLAQEAVKKGWRGLEFYATIPGSVGGAIRGNAGAFGRETKDVLTRVRVFDGKEERWLANEECQFVYRESMFKKDRDATTGHNQYVILEGEFRLEKGDAKESTKYMREILAKKAETQTLESPSAGCVFANVEFVPGAYDLKDPKHGNPTDAFKHEVPKEMIERGVVSAGWMIDCLGLKGKTMGGAKVSDKHGNFIVNTGKAKATDIVMLLSFLKQQVRDQFGIQLQEEIQMIGF
ncbi:UDP-N-acetylmuramate dehydrogenase [Candidatus Uhrbacteria bacterium]|nr:UDP-N-acetylmuramate dehydrogenase [Candidatus Uhrbacteria bacterium]